jgi:putative MATE family efflux protein
MKDLTRDSIPNHLLVLAAPIVVSMLTTIAYQLVDLYFVTRLGITATAGVNVAGTAMYFHAALAQVLSVGTTPLIAQAVGRKDRIDANVMFNQSLTLAVLTSAVITGVYIVGIQAYLQLVAADPAAASAGTSFILWSLPGVALLLPIAALSSGLRGIGVVRPTIVISMLTVVLKTALAPVLIAGWGTGLALGISGAGLTTSIATVVGFALLLGYLRRPESYLTVDAKLLRPQLQRWRRIVALGFPAGLEIALVFLSTAGVYYIIRDLGAATQAGYGIGSRVMQALLLPGFAIGFAVGPIAAQNFGARDRQRVIETFHTAAYLTTSIMVAIAIVVQLCSAAIVSMFDTDPAALDVAAEFLRSMSWAFMAQGLIYACSNMFQGIGNTMPSLASSAIGFLSFAAAAIWLSAQPTYRATHVWYLLLFSTILQAALSLFMLRVELRKRLMPLVSHPSASTAP